MSRIWKALLEDRKHGSSVIFLRTLDALAEMARKGGNNLKQRVREMREAHPSRSLLLKLESLVQRTHDLTPAFFLQLKQAYERDHEQAVQQALHLLRRRNPRTLLTYSYSGMVLDVLSRYIQERPLTVIVSEGRPDDEGQIMAQALLDRGLHVRFTTDMGLFSFVEEADMVLVGADAVVPWGVVNKVGTSGLCLAAAKLEKTPYVLAVSYKFLNLDESRAFSFQVWEGTLWENAPMNLSEHVPLFDVTPFDILGGVIVEHGLLNPTEARLMTEQEIQF